MSHEKIGPKEAALRQMREDNIKSRNSKPPSAAELRSKISKIKPKAKQGGRRGR